jgi:sigma-B regulation protein RsbU (phosphoserine phosphatase)
VGQVTLVESTGVPIGLFCVKEYPVTRFRLAPGDLLVLYTDGVTEARNASDEEYGTERLSALVAAHAGDAPEAVVRACVEDLAAFRGRAPRADDVTVMVIHRTAAKPS